MVWRVCRWTKATRRAPGCSAARSTRFNGTAKLPNFPEFVELFSSARCYAVKHENALRSEEWPRSRPLWTQIVHQQRNLKQLRLQPGRTLPPGGLEPATNLSSPRPRRPGGVTVYELTLVTLAQFKGSPGLTMSLMGN